MKKKTLKTSYTKNKLNLSDSQFRSDKQTQLGKDTDLNVMSGKSEFNILNNTAITIPKIQDKPNNIDKELNVQNICDQKEKDNILDPKKDQPKITETANQNEPVRDNVDKIKIKICQNCNTHHFEGNCPIEYPHYVITDALDRNEWIKKYKSLHEKKNQFGNDVHNEVNKYSYSIVSLPNSLSISQVQDEQLRVFANIDLEPFTQFGPLIGKVVKEKDIPEDIEMNYIWEAVEPTGNTYFNTENTSIANWMRYLRPAPRKEEKNVTVISKEKKLYFITVKFISSGEELLYWQYNSSSTVKKKMEKTGIILGDFLSKVIFYIGF